MGEVVNGAGKRTSGSHGKTIYRGSLTENNSSQSSPKANASAHVKEDVAVLARQLAAVRGSVRGSFALDTCDDIRRIFGVFSRSMSPRAKMISLEHKPTAMTLRSSVTRTRVMALHDAHVGHVERVALERQLGVVVGHERAARRWARALSRIVLWAGGGGSCLRRSAARRSPCPTLCRLPPRQRPTRPSRGYSSRRLGASRPWVPCARKNTRGGGGS